MRARERGREGMRGEGMERGRKGEGGDDELYWGGRGLGCQIPVISLFITLHDILRYVKEETGVNLLKSL